MPKNEDKELFDTLRATGLRKKVARGVSATSAGENNEQSSAMRKTAERLRSAAAALEHRVDGPPARTRPAKKAPAKKAPAKRAPAKKAADTRQRRANRRVATRSKRATKGTRS